MQNLEQPTLTRNDFAEAINRCIRAHQEAHAKLPENAGFSARNDNQDDAYYAYLAELPLLIDPASFQLYIACISHGASLGIIDPVDVGRFCHIANTAISAWKLANLVIPAAQAKERAAAAKEAQAANSASSANSASPADGSTPLPSKGNHQNDDLSNERIDKAIQQALENMPMIDVQRQYFKLLRDRGIVLPSDRELRDHPLAALHFCRMAESIVRKEAPAGISPQPEASADPGTDQQNQSSQAA